MSPARESEIPTTPTIPCLASWKHGVIFDQANQIAFSPVYYKPLQTTSANFQTPGRGMSSSKIIKEIFVLLKHWRFLGCGKAACRWPASSRMPGGGGCQVLIRLHGGIV